MRNVYIATELMGIIIILILLYANIFGEQHNAKKKIFTRLLISNGVVVLTDMVSWFQLGWENKQILLGILVTITYFVPCFIQATFVRYLYEHLSERAVIRETPFKILKYYSIVIGMIAFILCIAGKMFRIEDGKYYPGSFELVYYLCYVIVLVAIVVVVLVHHKTLGRHGMTGALAFCLLPLASIVLAMILSGFNPAVPAMAIDVLLIYVLLQSERETTLLFKSNNDELTGLYNRRACEEDIEELQKNPLNPDFVYASIDINGLKQVNDNLGHAAGDEMIRGAAECLKRTLCNFGRVYRTGGDEFVALFYSDEEHLKKLLNDLRSLTEEWSGSVVESLAMSIGVAAKREFTAESIEEMAKIADKRMYEDKRRYYAKKGVDRRGQNEAHTVLCSLYTKILKINLTTDSYSIINMNLEEQTKVLGFTDRISVWLEGFARSGGVHPDDLDAYLKKTDLAYMRDYFSQKKTSLMISYRRKYGDEYKQVVMEIIPARDYSEENQSLFLYVKNIDML